MEFKNKGEKMSQIFDIEPKITSDVYFGDTHRKSVVYAGKLAERSPGCKIFFDGSDNFVVFEVGKRGSGKSYGMGSLLESFATNQTSCISDHTERKAILKWILQKQ